VKAQRLIAFIGFAVAALSSGQAGAQPVNEWMTDCAIDQTAEKQECTLWMMISAITRKPDDILSLSYSLSKGSFAVVGPKEAGRAHIQVDANQAFEMTGCVNAICPLPSQPSTSLLEQMRAGSILSVEMVTKRGNIVGPYNVSLTGFANEYQQALRKQQVVVKKPVAR
jgi:invasion protein IalB